MAKKTKYEPFRKKDQVLKYRCPICGFECMSAKIRRRHKCDKRRKVQEAGG